MLLIKDVDPTKEISESLDVKVTSAVNVIGPVYDCEEPVVIFAPIDIPPVLDNTSAPLVVNPVVDPTVPTAKPLFSKKEIVPVLAANVVMALEVFVKVYAPPLPKGNKLGVLMRFD